MSRTALACLAVLALCAPAAQAGETACRFEQGVVVAPAQVMGVAGDYLIDTGTPHTQLAETQAQSAGFADTALVGEVRLAGVALAGRPVAVANLDMRTGALPSPVAGVVGADVLAGYVVDVSFFPCRVALYAPGSAPRSRWPETLRLTWIEGRPTVPAVVSDGERQIAGAFTPAIGSDTAVRISDVLASVPGAARPRELYPYGVLRPKLAAMAFAGQRFADLPAGLVGAENPDLAGEIGAPVLARFRLRFDFPAGRLRLAPAP